jgi:transposase
MRTALNNDLLWHLVDQVAPQLLAEPGFGPPTAGKLIGEIAGAQRFSSDAKLARAGGIAPIPVSSGKTNRHASTAAATARSTPPSTAVTRARCHPESRTYIDRKRAEGKTHRDAIRCLKRQLARRVWHLLQPPTTATPGPGPSTS